MATPFYVLIAIFGVGQILKTKESTWVLGGRKKQLVNTFHNIFQFDYLIWAPEIRRAGTPSPKAGAAVGQMLVFSLVTGGGQSASGSQAPARTSPAPRLAAPPRSTALFTVYLWLNYTTYSNSHRIASNFTDLPSRHHFLKVSPCT